MDVVLWAGSTLSLITIQFNVSTDMTNIDLKVPAAMWFYCSCKLEVTNAIAQLLISHKFIRQHKFFCRVADAV